MPRRTQRGAGRRHIKVKKQAYPKVIANLTTTSDVQLNFKEITLMLARSIAEFQNVLVIKNKRNIKLIALGFKGDATINLKHGDRCYIVANGKMLNLYNGEECTRTGWEGFTDNYDENWDYKITAWYEADINPESRLKVYYKTR